ncbi:MAG: misacylated tRNA(Ala) deacylase [Chloroflexi bacterium]|jgi:misacylated tRNA(Ala) deacylase|nr:MAG: misacylated tRNA(Ala) deacylase [Chloroflexota bacterium]
MTRPLYHEDSYLKEFHATIVEKVDGGVILHQSAFYPGGGGQPSDEGILKAGSIEYSVTRIKRNYASLIHVIDGETPEIGTEITGVINWGRRYQLMRTHTGLHILCGIIWRDYGALVTGGDMQPLKARMDFELEHMSADFAKDVEQKVNAEVAASRPVSTDFLEREQAMKIPDLIRTKINLLPTDIKQIRVVNIHNLDMQADGGTHVANTTEVGLIRVVGHESKGRINKRLRIEIADK